MIPVTNVAYKCIIRDRAELEKKALTGIQENDLIVHKSIRSVDADIARFEQQMKEILEENEKINDSLSVEFGEDKRDMHKKKFEYKETFIRNMSYEEDTYDDTKKDFIEFYQNQKKQADDLHKKQTDFAKYFKEDTFDLKFLWI